jgi:tight adherence protein C
MILVVLAVLLAGVAVALIARGASFTRTRVAASVGRIEAYGFEQAIDDDEPRDGIRALVDSIAGIVGGVLAPRLTQGRQTALRRELIAAGFYRLTPRKFIGYRALAAIGCVVLGVWLTAQFGLSGIVGFAAIVGLGGTGWYLPLVSMRSRAERRLARIDYELPELIDILIVAVEAGLGFVASMQLAASRVHGPLGDELRLTLQEQRMGLSTNESLRNMLQRAGTPGVESFVRSILQGETLGVSIGQILRDLALEMRKRRRAAAEERAQKAPIKLLFPLIFLIFPAMFVVILGPAIFTFFDVLGD